MPRDGAFFGLKGFAQALVDELGIRRCETAGVILGEKRILQGARPNRGHGFLKDVA